MAIVPRARNQVGAPAPQRVVGVQAAQTGAGQLSQGLDNIVTAMDEWQDEVDTADAKAADARYSDEVRRMLYEDGEGFMNRMGGDAVKGRDTVNQTLKDKRDEILGGLGIAARKKAESAIENRYQQAATRVDTHTSGERRTFLNDTANARVKSAVSDAIYDPAQVQSSIGLVVQEAFDAGKRNGWSDEVVKSKIVEGQTEIHSGIVKRIAAQSPIEAMKYLQDNKSKMLGSEVAALSGQLAPAVKEYKGRQAGRAAFQNGAILKGFETHERDIAGKVRNIPVSKEYQIKVSSVVKQLGDDYDIKVVSGAQPQKGSGGKRTGSTRHDVDDHGHGHTADLVLTRKGKPVLPGEDPALYEKFFELAGSKFTGMGHYSWGIHVGGGSEAFWGPDTTAASANARFAAAAARGRSGGGGAPESAGGGSSSAIQSIIDIQDPDERDAALREYKLLAGAREDQATAQREAAADAAFRMIEGGGNIDDLPIDFRQNLGRDDMASLRTYQDKLTAGEAIETDPEMYVTLSNEAADNPDAFTKLNPILWRGKLNDTDFKKFTDLQRTIKNEGTAEAKKAAVLVDAPTLSALRTASSSALKAAGLEKGDEKQIAQFEADLMQWAEAFTREGNVKPNNVQINEKIGQMLTPVVMDGKGFWGKANFGETPAFAIDYEGKKLDRDDDLTLADVQGADIKINGTKVPNDKIEAFVSGWVEEFERSPTAEEVITGLIRSELF